MALPAHFRIPGLPGLLPAAHAILLLLFLLIVAGPLVMLAADLISGIVQGSAPALFLPLLSPRRFVLLVQTFGFAGAVAAAGTATGILLVSALWRKPRSLTVAVLVLALALVPVPPYIHALAWSSAIAAVNSVLAAAGAAPFPVSGWLVSFWVQYLALLPVAVLLCWAAFVSVDRTLVDAARTLRRDRDVFYRIILALAAPMLTAAAGFLFVLSCTDYAVPSLFGSDTYALDIFALYSTTGNAAGALVSALPLLLVTVLVIGWCRTGIRHLAQTPRWTTGSFELPLAFGPGMRILQEGALALFCLQVLVTMIGLVPAVFPFSRFAATIGFAAGEIRNSFLITVLAVLIALPLMIAAARRLFDAGTGKAFWWWVVLIPLAIPAPLTGIGLVALWNTPPLTMVYGTILMPVFAGLARFSPVGVIVIYAQLRSLDPALIDAARVFSRDDLYPARTILLPLLAPGLLIAAALLAALTLGELGATLVVIPPGLGTLAIKIYNYLHFGAASEVAGLCLVMAAAGLAAGAGIASVVRARTGAFPGGTHAPGGDDT